MLHVFAEAGFRTEETDPVWSIRPGSTMSWLT
jgi:hypothetical protein